MSDHAWAVRAAEDYLAAMEARDLERARTFVAPGALDLVFPGGRHLTSLDGIVRNSSGRYRTVRKTVTRRESWVSDGGVCALIAGTLHGEWADGSPFEDIRFLDLFDFVDGKIVRQHVWNDAGEIRLALTQAGERA